MRRMTNKVNLSSIICSLAFFILITPCFGEELRQCPDLSAHERVLKEGESAIPKESFGGFGGFGGFGPNRLSLYEGYPYTSRTVVPPENVDVFLADPASTNALALINYAHAYERKNDFISAEKVYEKLLTIQKNQGTEQTFATARAFEDLGAVMILRALEKTDEAPRYDRLSSGQQRWRFGGEFYETRQSMMSLALLQVLHFARNSDALTRLNDDQRRELQIEWSMAEDCYLSALKIRSAIDATAPNTRFSILMLAALSEWKQNQREAMDYLNSALQLSVHRTPTESPKDFEQNRLIEKMKREAREQIETISGFPSASDAYVDYCIYRANWDLATNAEKDLISNGISNSDDVSLQSLLTAYVRYKRQADADRLFKELLTAKTSKEGRLKIPANLFSEISSSYGRKRATTTFVRIFLQG